MLLALATMPAMAAPQAPLQPVSTEVQTYIVVFEGAEVPAYMGGIPGYKATSIEATGDDKLDVDAPEVQAYRAYLQGQQAAFIAKAEKQLGHALNVKFQYQLSLNGMAVELTASEALRLSKMDGVVDVVPDWVEYPQTDVGPGWVEADQIWAGVGDMMGTKGEGMVVGILDTGINYDHPSFSDDPADYNDDYTYTWDGDYLGWCAPGETYTQTFECNDKLVGLWSADADTPDDYNGHGSHVGSTVAGNYITATVYAPTATVTRSISGVAPHAHVVGYNIEATQGQGSATGAGIVAATEAAIEHGVDVINYSFGSGGADPWVTAWHWLNVRKAGIFVATSAGNAGPGAGTIGSPANAPWMLSVANSSHTRKMENALIDMTPDGPDDMVGKGFTSGYGPAEIVYAGWYSDTIITGTMVMGYENASQCLIPFPAGTFDGEIVVCDRGQIARVAKAENVAAGGAGGFVLVNVTPNFLAGDSFVIPGVHLAMEDGVALKGWLTSTVVQTATVQGYTMNITDTNADIINASSSRGPNYVGDVIKPDVTAPGTDILAAVATDHANPAPNPEFDFYSGTSMASPHAAGVALLLRKLHPDWTAAEIQAAMTSTADNSQTRNEDGSDATPFDTGAGSVRAAHAAMAGLVLDESYEDFWAANPAMGGDPTALNLATIANDACVGNCMWERTLKSSLDVTATWEINTMNPTSVTLTTDPVSFTLAPGAEVTVKVMADAMDLPVGEWAFGAVQFTTDVTSTVSAHFPVAVKNAKTNLPDMMTIKTDKDMGSETIEDVQVLREITDMTVRQGMAQAEYAEGYIVEDDDQDWIGDFFGKPNFGNLMVMTYTVSALGEYDRLVAEVITTTSPDLDLFIIRDKGWYACQSATGATLEYCSIAGPDLITGTYNVVVHNYKGSGVMSGTAMLPDRVVMGSGLLAFEDPSELTVTAPDTVAMAEMFDVDVAWDVSDYTTNTLGVEPPYRWYGVFDLGKDASSPGCIGMTSVDLHYTPMEAAYIYLPLVTRDY
jgi:subtilisin family serine protease